MENTALIIIDLQIGVQPENVPLYNLANVINGVNQRIRLFREKNNPIIFGQHNDSDLVLNIYWILQSIKFPKSIANFIAVIIIFFVFYKIIPLVFG
ncbi:hypothetical protein [Neobacillus sp. PS3-40]|uniref:hypothetical protein n=1 Tax=Neobacillus sp. PS3-40 TaxID=3070679 RepID=UPI0027DEC331|nr:hypothetical protein [Neobacillus sp. PS3-40]WML46138.1 hypothetical protein RCG20_09710 [Neobacillus sp. PS3-40]